MIRHLRISSISWCGRFSSSSFPGSCWTILSLFNHLSSNSLNKKQQNILIPAVGFSSQICFRNKPAEYIKSCTLMSCNQRFALAFLPTVTVCCWACSFEFAIMTLVTNSCTFSATAKGLSKSTSSTLENILVYVFSSCPSE